MAGMCQDDGIKGPSEREVSTPSPTSAPLGRSGLDRPLLTPGVEQAGVLTDVVTLEPHHVPVAGAVLARSLLDDGLTRHMYPDGEERRARTPWHFSAMVRYGVLFGRVQATAREPRGVAVWLPLGETAMTDNRIAAPAWMRPPQCFERRPFGRFVSAMA